MAFENRPWSITYTFKDREGNVGSATVYVDETLDWLGVEAKASAMAGFMGNLSDSPITQYTISRLVTDPVSPQPPEISDVERKGRFVFKLADTRTTSVSVPSIKNSLVIDGSNLIDTANVAVAAFAAAVIEDGADRVGVDINNIASATKRHIKNGQG